MDVLHWWALAYLALGALLILGANSNAEKKASLGVILFGITLWPIFFIGGMAVALKRKNSK